MILVDANLLVYAYVKNMPAHEQASRWLNQQFDDQVSVGLPWPSLLAFIRLVSNPKVFERPASIALAWGQVKRWLAIECVWIPEPTSRHEELLEGLIEAGAVHRATLIPDAHLAVLAMEYGLRLCSADRDFARFEGLDWHNPLKEA